MEWCIRVSDGVLGGRRATVGLEHCGGDAGKGGVWNSVHSRRRAG